MRKYIVFALIIAISVIISCGGNGGHADKVKGEAKQVAEFCDALLQEGNLNKAFAMLAAQDKAILGMMIPGFYDFILGKESDALDENMKLVRSVLPDMVPIPSNLVDYKIGETRGSGDTAVVPVIFSMVSKNIKDFLREYLEPGLYNQLENIDGLNISFDEKREIALNAIKEIKAVAKGKTFEMESLAYEFTLIKENGQWKLSALAGDIINLLGEM